MSYTEPQLNSNKPVKSASCACPGQGTRGQILQARHVPGDPRFDHHCSAVHWLLCSISLCSTALGPVGGSCLPQGRSEREDFHNLP